MKTHYSFLILLIHVISIHSQPICEEGKSNCLKCNPITNLCYKCEKTIYVPDDKGGCQNSKTCILGNNYCSSCNKEETLCEECDSGYFPDENGGCSNIPNCEISYKGECLKCIDDFILIGDKIKICVSKNSEKFKNCEEINTLLGVCMKCSENYFLNEGDKKCISIENCYESSFGICQICKQNYYLNKRENICKVKKDNLKLFNCKITLDEEKCELCEENYYLDSYGYCIETNHCKRGNELNQCERCISGYYLSSDNTCTNDKNCFYGDKDMGICTNCKFNYYLDFKDGKCKSNLEDNEFKFCQKVVNGICTECRTNYYLGKDDKCSSSKHCIESDLGKCLECEEGSWLGKDNRCTNITKCIATDSYNDECIECEDGYYFNKNDKKCKEWERYFENCKNGNDNSCLACKDGYYLKKKEYMCLSNEDEGQFYKCTESSFYGDLCIWCAKGYYLGLDYKCSNITGCVKSEHGNTCYECNMYYCLDMPTHNCIDNKKVINEEKMFYFKCNRTNEEGNKCQKCINGYNLNEKGLCVNDKGCKKKEGNKCTECNVNYCMNNNFECVSTNDKYCLECNDILDFNKCTKCQEGFELDEDNQCVEKD